jgi:hypothetical protein
MLRELKNRVEKGIHREVKNTLRFFERVAYSWTSEAVELNASAGLGPIAEPTNLIYKN